MKASENLEYGLTLGVGCGNFDQGDYMNHQFDILFKPSEFICVSKDAFGVDILPNKLAKSAKHKEFFSVNPILEGKTRADYNVSAYRNFLFEIDCLPLEDQLKLLTMSSINFASIVYSGNKSYHAIVSLENDLDLEPSKAESKNYYKLIWNSIEQFLVNEAKQNGFVLGSDKSSFFDQSCKNPSRFSRTQGIVRENTGKVQELVKFGRLMSSEELNYIMSNSTSTLAVSRKYEPENLLEDTDSFDEFERKMPQGLKYALITTRLWAKSAGMYPELFKIALWAIDSTGVSKQVLLMALDKYSAKPLSKAGYDVSKIDIPINHAYFYKGVR